MWLSQWYMKFREEYFIWLPKNQRWNLLLLAPNFLPQTSMKIRAGVFYVFQQWTAPAFSTVCHPKFALVHEKTSKLIRNYKKKSDFKKMFAAAFYTDCSCVFLSGLLLRNLPQSNLRIFPQSSFQNSHTSKWILMGYLYWFFHHKFWSRPKKIFLF